MERDFHELSREMYEGSWFTVIGCDIISNPIEEWVTQFNKIFESEGCPTVPLDEWVAFTGGEVNKEFALHGKDAYNEDLHFLACPIDRFNTTETLSKLAIIKLKIKARWYDDIVKNDIKQKGLE